MSSAGLLSVLWVEDDPLGVEPLRQYLASHGCRIDFAFTAVTGLELARRRAHDVLLLDSKLPDWNGLQLLQQIRAEGMATPVVVLTGFASYDMAVEVGRLGGQALRAKPDPGRALLATLRHARARTGPSDSRISDGRTWAARVGALLDEATDRAKAHGGTFGREGWNRLLRALALELAESDVTVPGELHGLRAFKGCVKSRAIDWPPTDMLEASRRLIDAVPFTYSQLHHAVAGAVTLFEAGGQAATHVLEHVLARDLGIDAAHFGRILKAETKLGFRRWRSGARLREAVAALVHSSGQIGQIATACGWKSLKAFERQFKAEAGVSPVEFRRSAGSR